MNSAFYTLFKRGKYFHGRSPVSDEEQSKPEIDNQKRKMEEKERFAVAAIAFCLRHSMVFRAHFFEKVCRLNSDEKLNDNDFRIEVEENNWADLRLHNAGITYVIEFKIGADLQPKQNPTESEFWDKEKSGYGYEMVKNGTGRYTILGYKPNLALDKNPTVKVHEKEIICRQCQWSVLSGGLDWSKHSIISDLFICLGNLGVEHFEFMNAKELQIKQPLDDAVRALLIFDAIQKHFKLKGEYDFPPTVEDSSWYLGFNISPKGEFGRKLADATGNAQWPIAWFGYQESNDHKGKSERAVWLYCADREHAEKIRAKLKFDDLVTDFRTLKSDWRVPDCWDVTITSPIGEIPKDCEWFQSVFDQLQ